MQLNSNTISLALTEDERLLDDSARDFLAAKAPISALRRLRDSGDITGYSWELWREMAGLGWTGLMVPESHGGSGLGVVAATLICEHMGRTLVASPFISTAVVFAYALNRYGSAQQKDRLLPKIAAGELTGALAVDESGKHAPQNLLLQAESAGDGWTLSGRKVFVDDGHTADIFIVAARTGGNVSLFLIDAKARGVTVERRIMIDSRNSATVNFEQVSATKADLLCGQDAGADALDHILDAARTVLAAELSGAAQQVFSLTISHLSQRKQFGVAIGSFQALQFRAATLFTEIELAKSAVLAAARKVDCEDADAAALVSIAKAKAGSTATLAGAEGVQLHGGMGMTDELDVGLYMKRIRVAQERYGDINFHADRLARLHNY